MIISDELAKECVESGLYDTIGSEMMAMEASALALAEYGTDFCHVTEHWSGNYSYKDSVGAEWKTNIIGEIAPAFAGSIISAKGNHYAARAHDFHPLDDASKARDVLVIKCPSNATDLLNGLFYNQIGSLNAIRESDEEEENVRGQSPNKNRNNKRLTKCTLSEFNSDADATSSGTSVEVNEPRAPEICSGAFYDPHLNPDFGGPYFNLIQNKLVQLDVVDLEGILVPPWKFYDALKPERPGLKKLYQINAHRVRILATSDAQPFLKIRPTIPSDTIESGRKSSISCLANDAFANFNPNKRLKITGKTGVSTITGIASTSKQIADPTVRAPPASIDANIGSMLKKSVSNKRSLNTKLKKKVEDERMDED
ncbi:hypothetical protein C0992_002553 [Termitomyces sp. T32_za158]|nr:hypothetical protein C0992_002553 [Termitomyces sp. T32_za158]